jgi:hypothetical protein
VQSTQTVAATPEKVPASHCEQLDVSGEELNDPELHFVHALFPAAFIGE